MKKNYTTWLCLLIGLVTACHQADVVADQPLQIQQARVIDDPSTRVDIDQQTHTITVSPSTFKAGRIRDRIMNLLVKTSINAVLGPVNPNLTPSLEQPFSFDVTTYDNSKPTYLRVRPINTALTTYQDYQLLLKAAGPVRFELMQAGMDSLIINLKNYQRYLVNLPVSNLYDGRLQDYQIYAIPADGTSPIELTVGNDGYSPDYVQFYFDRQKTKPGVYQIELRKSDGQRSQSSTQVIVKNS
ncbi:hypothetical protein [Tellurirhabdus rosea]|uniref:hypothetical protein n=1 Tax=Tellurirhabdus rosea TaxID=2674997 RepID=UPI002256601B|nr:hypothetical protein [Tellurirhabdus rosea]